MKTSTVSLTLWFTQVLTLCALRENLLTTPKPDVSATTSENLTTSQDVSSKTAAVAAMTTTTSADGVFSDLTLPLTPTPGLCSFTSLVEKDGRNQEISTSHHNIMSLAEKNNTSFVTGYQEKGSGTESTNKNIRETTEISTSIQLDHDVQRTSFTNRIEDGTSGTDEANTTTMPLIYSTHEAEVTLSNRSYGTIYHQSPLPSTAGTSYEIRSTSQNLPDISTNTDTPSGTSGHISITATLVPTQVTRDSTESTEEPVVSSTKTMDWKTEKNTEEPVVSSTKTMDWKTEKNTEEPVVSSTKTMEWKTEKNTEEPVVSSTKTMEWKTEKNTEEPVVSSTKTMDWKMETNTEALTTTQGTFYENTTNTTQRDRSQPRNTGDSWSTNITTSKNNSSSETHAPHWTNCFNQDSSSQPHRFSKLVCFLTMWTLAVTASFFLGLTVFLWVRLSIIKKRARHRGRRERDGKGQGPAAKEKESLWAEPGSSAEERVEFWYANGATVEEGRRRHRARQVRTRTNGERAAETEEDMWIQPMVTLKDITEFWHANRGARHADETQVVRERDRESEGDDGRHTE